MCVGLRVAVQYAAPEFFRRTSKPQATWWCISQKITNASF